MLGETSRYAEKRKGTSRSFECAGNGIIEEVMELKEIEVPGVEDRAIFLLCFSIEEILSMEVCTHSLITEHMFG